MSIRATCATNVCCTAYVPSTVSMYALLSRLVAKLTPCNMATSYSSLLTASFPRSVHLCKGGRWHKSSNYLACYNCVLVDI